ncbi:hypothetical protein AAIH16_41540, partial [Pseudomonas aeruginosa]
HGKQVQLLTWPIEDTCNQMATFIATNPAFTSNALLISIPVTLRQREVGLNLLNTPKTICLIRKKGTDLFSLL